MEHKTDLEKEMGPHEKRPEGLLAWDSEFFGFPVTRIDSRGRLGPEELSEAIFEMSKRGVRLAYVYVEPQDEASNRAASEAGGRLVDRKAAFRIAIDPHGGQETAFSQIRSAFKEPLNPALLSLALQSGEYSRFRKDPAIAAGKYEAMYRAWIEKSLSGESAFDVLVYHEGEQEKGLITLEDRGEWGGIGLVAVDRTCRGSGAGRKLVTAALQRFKQRGFPLVRVVTQMENIPACRLYQRAGFELEEVVNIYHLWMD